MRKRRVRSQYPGYVQYGLWYKLTRDGYWYRFQRKADGVHGVRMHDNGDRSAVLRPGGKWKPVYSPSSGRELDAARIMASLEVLLGG